MVALEMVMRDDLQVRDVVRGAVTRRHLTAALLVAAMLTTSCADDAHDTVAADAPSDTTAAPVTTTSSASGGSADGADVDANDDAVEVTATTEASAPTPAAAPPAELAPEDPRLRLVGKTFTGTTVTEGGKPRPLVDDTDITITFEHNPNSGDDVARWNAGCNNAGSPVDISADRLDIGPDGGSTDAGCPQANYDQDDWLRAFFHADPFWTLDNGTLTLTVDDAVITLIEEPQN